MRITAFIGAALLGLCMLAFAPVAMAGPLPDICVLDPSQPITLDQAIDTAGKTCAVMSAVNVAAAVPIGPDDDEVAGTCTTKAHATVLDVAGHRQHEDPGRCAV